LLARTRPAFDKGNPRFEQCSNRSGTFRHVLAGRVRPLGVVTAISTFGLSLRGRGGSREDQLMGRGRGGGAWPADSLGIPPRRRRHTLHSDARRGATKLQVQGAAFPARDERDS